MHSARQVHEASKQQGSCGNAGEKTRIGHTIHTMKRKTRVKHIMVLLAASRIDTTVDSGNEQVFHVATLRLI